MLTKRIRTAVLGLVATAAVTACTPQQIADWVAWNERDPVAAQEFANLPQIQALLHGDSNEEADSGGGGGWTLNWDAVAQCESGQNWSHRPVTNSAGTFSGGLMWNHRYWLANGGGQYAQFPYQATKAQQIRISENVINGSYATADRMWQCIGGPARSGV